MQRRQLGANGPSVSVLGIGAMSFSNFYGRVSELEAHAILDSARENAIDHVDTANVYGMGQSEQFIGSYLKNNGLAGNPPFVIATKASIGKDPETGARTFNNQLSHLRSELEKSLTRLELDAVDLFYVHRRDPGVPIEDVTGSLMRLIEEGKIKSFGYSEIAPSSLRRAAAVHPVAAVQSEYSLSCRSPEVGLVQTCHELGTALVAFSPVGRGLLTDTPPSLETAGHIDFFKSNPRFQSPNLAANLAATEPFRALAADLGLSAAGLAIAWLCHQGSAVLPIPGTRSISHFKQLIDGANKTLTTDELAEIEKALPIGWAHGDRYSAVQWVGPERYA
jgi:aryl-alcohol dehydrogenase-like predicted oxidoreductase